jgi:hypothetical protein
MKKFFYVLLNHVFRRDLAILFGEGSKIVVNDVKYLTNTKSYHVSLTLYLGDVDDENLDEIIQDGLEYLVMESWKYSGKKEKLSMIYGLNI